MRHMALAEYLEGNKTPKIDFSAHLIIAFQRVHHDRRSAWESDEDGAAPRGCIAHGHDNGGFLAAAPQPWRPLHLEPMA